MTLRHYTFKELECWLCEDSEFKSWTETQLKFYSWLLTNDQRDWMRLTGKCLKFTIFRDHLTIVDKSKLKELEWVSRLKNFHDAAFKILLDKMEEKHYKMVSSFTEKYLQDNGTKEISLFGKSSHVLNSKTYFEKSAREAVLELRSVILPKYCGQGDESYWNHKFLTEALGGL